MLSSLKLGIGYCEGIGKGHLSLVGGIGEGFLEEEMSALGFKEREENK